MRNEKEVENLGVRARSHAVNAARRNGSTGELSEVEQYGNESDRPDSPFPYLEVVLRKAKDSPWMVLTLMVAVGAIIVGAIVSFTVGFGIFLFSMNGTMHEVKAQQGTLLTEIAIIKRQQSEDGNAMRAYEAANGKRTEFMVGLMTPDRQRAMNEYDRAHPLPRMPDRRERSQ